jgi:hypothetical protein
MQTAKLTGPAEAAQFILAGNATVTLRSMKTNLRFTYQIRQPKPKDDGRPTDTVRFVGLLSGPANETDYAYLGVLTLGPSGWSFRRTAKSRISEDAPGHVAFAFFAKSLFAAQPSLHPMMEVWHEGRCGRCGRKLTVPESIANGIGPECAAKVGFAGAFAVDDR